MSSKKVENEKRALVVKRAQVKAALTRFKGFVRNFSRENGTYHDIEARLMRINDLAGKFEAIQIEMEILTGEAQDYETGAFEDAFCDAVADATRLIETLKNDAVLRARESLDSGTGRSNSNGTATFSTLQASVKLPNINLPEFAGSYETWNAFHDIFVTLVHNNNRLNDVERFYYLQSCLKGEAAQLIHSIEISNANYSIAWALLKERFDHKKLIVNSHIKSIFDLYSVKNESCTQLRKLLDTFNKHFRALTALGQPTDKWDALIIYILSNKLDANTKREWEQSICKDDIDTITISKLTNFINERCNLLESLEGKSRSGQKHFEKTSTHLTTDKNTYNCAFCGKGHANQECDKFAKQMTVQERYEAVRKQKLCLNCLRPGHFANECRTKPCPNCNRKHNALLHGTEGKKVNITSAPGTNERGSVSESTTTLTSHTREGTPRSQVILATVIVQIKGANGSVIPCRALLDSGSQTNFITTSMLNKLNAKPHETCHSVTGINGNPKILNKKVELMFTSVDKKYTATESFLVTDKITDDLPQIPFDIAKLKIPSHVKLADNFVNETKSVNMLLGARVFFETLRGGQIYLGKNRPVLQQTKFGWIISGKMNLDNNVGRNTISLSILDNLNEQVQKFWKIEEVRNTKEHLTKEEQECEESFEQNLQRDNNGRFILALPLKGNYRKLGNSEESAHKRLLGIEKRMKRDETFRKLYVDFMKEYEALGHMKEIDATRDKPDLIKYYLPHHGVMKDSNTTKLRVVFDASCKTDTGISLNDVLKVGPTIQNDLCTIALNFRRYNVVVTADIEKMYRQCDIVDEHKDLQRILWRAEPKDEIKHYRLNTITYGTASASFLACRCLKQLAIENEDTYPEACKIIENNFYMDDLIAGADDLKSAKQLKTDLTKILNSGSFPLRKWCSNYRELLESDDIDNLPDYYITDSDTVKTLGLVWKPREDTFSFNVRVETLNTIVTKRNILANIARIFDPLGLINPVTVQGKLILQQLWREQIDWDEPISDELLTVWTQFYNSLGELSKLTIPRQVTIANFSSVEIHGFSDASERCYGACIYLRCKAFEGSYVNRLLCAKSKIAPCKKELTTLPRLELNGAFLLAQLLERILQSFDLKFTAIILWCDSTIVLNWISSDPTNWTTYVANRVAQIQNLTSNAEWRYVPSEHNPADILSRGCLTQNLINNHIWWNGPKFLECNSDEWPRNLVEQNIELPERKKNKKIVLTTTDTDLISDRFSKFSTLHKVFTYMLRFIHNTNPKNANRITNALTVAELNTSLNKLLLLMQGQCFHGEIECLKRGKPLPKTSKLLSLNVFLDGDGLIRVGGRLRQSRENFDKKHQILLPYGHPLTKLIIKHEHERRLHAGQQSTLSAVRDKYWPINGRNAVKGITRTCTVCFRAQPRNKIPIMGDLPASRITQSRPFAHTGVDYAGPILVKDGTTRCRKLVKSYICIFVCFVTKAIHLELAGDLSTQTFLNCLKRFVSRRGLCTDMYSDNGTNFVGAAKELKPMINDIKDNSDFKQFCINNAIQWHFNPPCAPNQGGLWESAVKAVKNHLVKVIGLQRLTFESMLTVLCQVEAALNSRPLVPLSEDPEDLTYLTPAHFLIGESLLAIPQRNCLNVPVHQLKLYEGLQHIFQHFWKRWSSEYLTTLQQRTKWQRQSPNVKINDLVLIRQDHMHPLTWPVGRITGLHPGADGTVRVVTILTAKGEQRRSVLRVCKFPIDYCKDTKE